MPLVRCPECDADLDVADEDLGQPMACGACGAEFTARADRRPRRDDRDEDFERPRRRRRQRWVVTEADVEDARRIVAAPAQGLILTGWISAVLCLLGGIASLAIGFVNLDDNDAATRDDAPGLLALGAGLVVLGVPYCVLIAIGGHRMKRLDGVVWVYTAAALGIAMVALCGPCVPITWAGVGVGIWAIVAVNKTVVKDVIEAHREGGISRDEDHEP
ncbi:MAG TPA: hypothetical protein VM597_22975 [Gemmataceae bacterium]|nr:hypothetical protein [Gemmataceae bacterium]